MTYDLTSRQKVLATMQYMAKQKDEAIDRKVLIKQCEIPKSKAERALRGLLREGLIRRSWNDKGYVLLK